jgi:hypothetical protein
MILHIYDILAQAEMEHETMLGVGPSLNNIILRPQLGVLTSVQCILGAATPALPSRNSIEDMYGLFSRQLRPLS